MRIRLNHLTQLPLTPTQAALWFLGQAGYVVRAGEITVALDPYLTDSVGAIAPELARCVPPPLSPEELRVDLFLVTHDHLDHLDPGTVAAYRYKDTTRFVAPRFAARKLAALGAPAPSITRVEVGETVVLNGVTISGVFALPTGPDVLDTVGFQVTFPNGRSLYLAGDTAYCPLLLQAAPRGVDVLLAAINGKWGNLNVEQAVELTRVVGPRYVLPNHYDVMALNSERPETFRYFCAAGGTTAEVKILKCGDAFIWGEKHEPDTD